MEINTERNENLETVGEDLKKIKEWLATQPHLISKLDDHFLLCFLRCCDFSLQETTQRLDNYYTARTMIPEIFSNRDPFAEDIQLILKSGAILPLSEASGQGGVGIVLIQWGVFNPSTMPYLLVVKVFYMIIDIILQESEGGLLGINVISDLKDLTLDYSEQFTVPSLYRAFLGMNATYPIKIRGFDIVNAPDFFNSIYSRVYDVLSPKLRAMTRIHTDIGPDFYKIIPQALLPKEYGGSAETAAELAEKWKTKVEHYSEWFKDDQDYYCNENLRPESSKNEIFEPDGTIRQLDIDNCF